MKEISIYQLRETRDYGFMGWDFAKDKFNFNDYDEVLNYTYNGDLSERELLDEIFYEGNNGKLHNQFPDVRFRSISVSDIIEVDGTRWYVDRFGFVNLENETEIWEME